MSQTSGVAQPALYSSAADGAVLLLASRCKRCGIVLYPRQTYGCERCGAHGGDLDPIDIPATGKLASFATVNRHFGKDILAPFLIGEIRLDAGPFIRCTLSAENPQPLAIGIRVAGVLAGDAAPELRFKPLES